MHSFAKCLALAIFLTPFPLLADDIRTETVQFDAGSNGTVIDGSVTGYEAVDYLLGARAGQTLSATLKSDNASNYFNVIPPDAESEADFIGSTEGNTFSGKLDLDGDWKLRVYLMRNAARRDEKASFTLSVEINGAPDPAAAREANDFGPRDWDARGDLPCARGGQLMQTAGCPFKVLRYFQDQGATVFLLTPATGAVRILYYQKGEWTTDSTEPVQANKREDLWSLVVGDEAYEVPDAVVLGG